MFNKKCNNKNNVEKQILKLNNKGAIFLMALIFLLIGGILAQSYIKYTSSLKRRAENGYANLNAAALGEAGAAQAVYNLQKGSWTGWTQASTYQYTLTDFTNTDGDAIGDFTVVITDPTTVAPSISSVGTKEMSDILKARTVQIVCSVVPPDGVGLFDVGLFGDESVDISGNGDVDSYDSEDGVYSDPGNKNENGEIGTNGNTAGVITIGGNNADIEGDATVGPGSDLEDAIDEHHDGQITGDENVASDEKDLDPVSEPDLSTAIVGPGSVSGWSSVNLSGTVKSFSDVSISSHATVIITGDTIWYVQGGFATSGQANIIIQPGASLVLYVEDNINMAGQGITNQDQAPEQCVIYGMDSCTSVILSGQSELHAAVYARNADIDLAGQADTYGSVVGNTISVTGNGSFHYDESLSNYDSAAVSGDATVTFTSWNQK